MTEAGYARILLDKKDTQIMELESEITNLRIEYERQIKELQEELEKWKAEWQEQVQKATDEGYARTQLQIENGKLKEQIEELKDHKNNLIINLDYIGNRNAELEKQNELLAKHILELQKDKGVLTDKVAELEHKLEIEKSSRIALVNRITDLEKQIEKMKSDSRTAYIKGIRTMANALKKYDREEGSWTDYFEHTVDKVLKNLLEEFGE